MDNSTWSLIEEKAIKNLDKKVENLKTEITEIKETLKNMDDYFKSSLEEIKDVMIKNHTTYIENKNLYIKTLEAIRLDPFMYPSRIYNRVWRTTYNNNDNGSPKGLMSLITKPTNDIKPVDI